MTDGAVSLPNQPAIDAAPMEQPSASRSGPLILMISFDFFPANEIGARRATALARFLVAQGYRVMVVSSFGNHEVKPGSEIVDGIIAVPVMRPSRILLDAMVALRTRLARRASGEKAEQGGLDAARNAGVTARKDTLKDAFFRALYFVDEFKRWSWRASRAAMKAARQHDARLVISTGPPHSALLAGTLAARALGVPHVADLRDPWTDCVSANPSQRLDYLLQRPLEKWVVRSAAGVTSAGVMVADLLARRYPDSAAKIEVVRNGYDGNAEARPKNTGGRLSILFAGELYLGRNPFPLLDALERLLQRPDVDADRVRVTFMGRVERYAGQSLAEWLIGKRLSRAMTLLPQRPAEEVNRAVSEATVLLNLAQAQPYSVPAKTYEHLICGREILVICESDSETARVVNGIRGVNQVDPRNPEDLESVLLDLYRRHAVEGSMTVPSMGEVRRFSRAVANERFLRIVRDLMPPDFVSRIRAGDRQARCVRAPYMSMNKLARHVARRVLPAAVRDSVREELVLRKLYRVISRFRRNGRLGAAEAQEFLLAWGNQGFSADLRFVAEAVRLMQECRGDVLECGTGATTIIAGLLAERYGFRVYSLEQDTQWSRRVRKVIARNSLTKIQVLDAPLKSFGDHVWYDTRAVSIPRKLGIVLCDGPFIADTLAGAIYSNWRYGILPYLTGAKAEYQALLLDDVNDPRAAAVIARWKSEFHIGIEVISTEDGEFGVIRASAPPGPPGQA